MKDNQEPVEEIGVGTVVRTYKWGHEDIGTVVRREGDSVRVVWHSLIHAEDELTIKEVEVWADAPPHLRDWRGPDPNEPIVVWLSTHSDAIAEAWLTCDGPDTFTFHSPTHSERVESLEAASAAARRWSIETSTPLKGPMFEDGVHPPYMQAAVDRAIEREANRSRMASKPREVEYEVEYER